MTAPKLRFKEFKNDWVKTNLGEVVKFSNGKRVPLSESERQKRQGSYRYYGASGVIDYLDDYLFDGEYILIGEDGANIITRSSTLAFVVTGKFWVNNHAHIFQSKEGNNIFLATYLESLNFEKFNSGTAQPKLNLENLKKVPVANPTKEEQTKIASFLSAVDEKISQLTQKHQLLSQYKQGMMQKLFSQQIRFKADDGSEFGEWDEYSLDTLLSKIIDNRGKTPVTEANLEIPLIEVNAIGQRRIKYEKVSKYFSEDTFQNWFRAYLEHQDILFSTVGNTAICSIYTDEIKAGIAQNIVGLRANTKLIQPTFLYYLLTEISNNQKFKSIEMQAVQPSIKVSQMIHLTFLTPCLEEQSKIANFLSSIDQKIEVVAQQIEQAKLWKKGLLQQMFV